MIIQSKRVYIDEKIVPAQLELNGTKIQRVLNYQTLKVDKDYGENLIMPGLVDIHNHGYMKYDANHATQEWLNDWTTYLPSEGVTSTLATISTYPYQLLLKSLKIIGNYIEEGKTKGSNILGVYSEGPFISEKFKGAQSVSNLQIPTIEKIKEMNEASSSHLIYVMVAPEMLNNDYSVIDFCKKNNITVAIGHTGATYQICQKAIDHGANAFTHTYNGMLGLHHREPGTVGCAMYHRDAYCECIVDGVHVHPVSANILASIKGKDRFIMVTDSVAIKGLPIGHYKDDTREVEICSDGVGRLADGTIAGSCNKLNKVLNFAINTAHIDIITAFNAVTINPLKLLNIKDKGLIKEGYDADLVVFDKNFNAIDTYVNGAIKYSKLS